MEKSVSAVELRELDPKAFEREHMEWARHLDWPWWDDTYEYWVEKLAGLGVCTDKDQMQFSGFWSQGDGASFTGHVDFLKFWEAHGAPAEYLPVAELSRNGMLGWMWLERRVSNYSHEQTVSLEVSFDAFPGDTLGHGIFAGHDAMEFCEEVVDPLRDDVTEWVLDTCRVYMREMYKQLEEEYEHLTSEESFIESCDINNVTFEVEIEEEEA